MTRFMKLHNMCINRSSTGMAAGSTANLPADSLFLSEFVRHSGAPKGPRRVDGPGLRWLRERGCHLGGRRGAIHRLEE